MKKILIFAVLVLICNAAFAQYQVSGNIYQEQKKVLAHASIQLKNTNFGTKSDLNGSFELKNIPEGKYMMQVSCIGFELYQQEITLKENTSLNISLKSLAMMAEEVTVSGTRAHKNSPTTFINISKNFIEKNNFAQDLPYIIQNTPSVVVNSDAGAGIGYTAMRIRGSDGTRTNITINGIPYNDSESSGSYFVNLPDFSSSINNIQIQRGVGTSTNGAGAFGASVNIQTAGTPLPSPQIEINNSFGSYNSFKNTLNMSSGLVNNHFSFDARLSQIKSDGYIDRASSKLQSFFVSGAYHGKNDLIRINIFSGKEKTYQSWYGVDESLIHDKTTRRSNYYTYPNQTDNYTQSHYQLLYSKQISPKLSLNTALHYTKGAGYYEEYKATQLLSDYHIKPNTVNGKVLDSTDLIRQRWLDNDFYGLTYDLNYKANERFNITFGGAYNQYRGNHFGTVVWAQQYPMSFVDKSFPRYYTNDADKNDLNFYLKTDYKITNKLLLFTDLQFRKIDYRLFGPDESIVLNNAFHFNFFNPKVGLTYLIHPYEHLYASYSVANREPVRKDFTDAPKNTQPKSENLHDIEAGYRIQKSNFNFTGNFFGMFYKNQLVETGKINDVGSPIRQNVANSYRMGIELDGSVQINPQILLNANTAFSRNKIKSYTQYIPNYDLGTEIPIAYKNVTIAYSPSVVSFAEIVYSPIKNLALAWQHKYVSQQFLDNTENNDRSAFLPKGSIDNVKRKIDAYYISNVRISYDFKMRYVKNINIGLLVNNIFNKMYVANGYTYNAVDKGYYAGNGLYPQASTNFMLNLNLKF